jgi:PAS domain S-box-containing protein
MPVMLNAFDAQGLLVVWNRECERVTGYAADEVIGNPQAMSLFYPDQDYLQELLHEWRLRGEDFLGWEWDLTCKDGSVRTIAWSSVAHRHPIPGWHTWATGVDVTDRRFAESRLREHESLLAHASRLTVMGEMVAGIAHEISQPLYAIGNYAQACLTALGEVKGTERPEKLRDWMRRIAAEASRAGEIIRRLGDFARRTDREEARLDLNTVVVESLELMNIEFQRLKINAAFHGAAAPLYVAGNRIQLQQVLVNLLRNACEALHNTLLHDRRISVTLHEAGTQAELIVEDSGPGLPADAGNRIFEAFFTTKPEGMGMGLAVSRSIVEAHGGRLWAVPRGGYGAEFHLSLPTVTGANSDDRTADGVRHR